MALLLLIALFAVFYFVLILPKQRELKRHNALIASLEVGDEVMTGSGFYGTLTEVDPDRVTLELAPGVEVRLARRAVAARVEEPEVDAAGGADVALPLEAGAPDTVDLRDDDDEADADGTEPGSPR